MGLGSWLCSPLTAMVSPQGNQSSPTDTHFQAGRGDTIYMVTGGDAVGVLPGRKMPVDAAIVGIVDSISHAERLPGNEEA